MQVQQVPTTVTKVSMAEMALPDLVYAQNAQTLKPWISTHDLQLICGTWYKQGRRVVTRGLHDKRMIIQSHHDPPVHGHPGIKCTTSLVERGYWWPGLRQDVLDYVKGCAECRRNKVNTRPTRAPLVPITPKPAAMPFETITLYFITQLSKANGTDHVLTVPDHHCT